MTAFVDEHRQDYGVEPICAELPIAHHRPDMEVPMGVNPTENINPTPRHEPPPRGLPLTKEVFRQEAADSTLTVRTPPQGSYQVTSASSRKPRPQTGGTGRQIFTKALKRQNQAESGPPPGTGGPPHHRTDPPTNGAPPSMSESGLGGGPHRPGVGDDPGSYERVSEQVL